MKKTFKWMSAMLAVIAIAFAVTFTSCGDDEPDQTNIYTGGFVEMSSTSLDVLREMQTIENAYKAELGEFPIMMTGSAEKCDAEIVAKCKKAEDKLANTTFTSEFKYAVTNATTGKEIYSHTFK